MNEKNKRLATKLNLMRREKGLDQQELAERVGVSSGAISQWESGRTFPTKNNLCKLANYFGVTPAFMTKPVEINYFYETEISDNAWEEVKNPTPKLTGFTEYKNKPEPVAEPNIADFVGTDFVALSRDRYDSLIEYEYQAQKGNQDALEQLYNLTCDIQTSLKAMQDALLELVK